MTRRRRDVAVGSPIMPRHAERAAMPAGSASPSALNRFSARLTFGSTGTQSSVKATVARDAVGASRSAWREHCRTVTAAASPQVQRSHPLPATRSTIPRSSSLSAIP